MITIFLMKYLIKFYSSMKMNSIYNCFFLLVTNPKFDDGGHHAHVTTDEHQSSGAVINDVGSSEETDVNSVVDL